MEGSEILTIFFGIFMSFVLGAIAVFLFGGRTALNYLIVKASRGKKVLLFVKSAFGWRSVPALKEENNLIWKFDKKKYTTSFKDGELGRYMRVDTVFVKLDAPTQPMSIREGGLAPKDFDMETYNNILIRALTRPNINGMEELVKLVKIILGLVVVTLLGVLLLYMKVKELTGGAGGGII